MSRSVTDVLERVLVVLAAILIAMIVVLWIYGPTP